MGGYKADYFIIDECSEVTEEQWESIMKASIVHPVLYTITSQGFKYHHPVRCRSWSFPPPGVIHTLYKEYCDGR